MDVLKLSLFTFAVLSSGCQMGYYLKSARSQLSIIRDREPIDEVLKKPDLSDETRAHLKTAQEARDFAIQKMGLKETKNYTTFVQLNRPYVSWVVSAAPRWRLEHFQWDYPIVGKMPYKGFTSEEDAKDQQKDLETEGLDTYVRGVSAYSTLGWFQDSVLSSMFSSRSYQLVNTIVHETTHTTLYIHNSADFNERLAVFVGNKGTEEFYRAKEGADSPTLQLIHDENQDDQTFSDFIGPKLKALEKWYQTLALSEHREELRQEQFKSLQADFEKEVLPKMRTHSYDRFAKSALNNARLLYYRTYMQDLKDFETLFDLVDSDWKRFLVCAKTLEKAEKPAEALQALSLKLQVESSGPRSCGK